MSILPAQKSLRQNGSALPFGVYDGLIPDVSTAHWDKQGMLIKKRRAERKAWIFYGFFSEELTCGMAIADAGALALGFSYFFVPKENLFIEDKITIPLGFGNDFDPGLNDHWQLKNYSIKSMNGKMYFDVAGKFNLKMEADFSDNGISVVAPSKGDRPFNFTYKNLPMPTKATVNYKGKVYEHSGNFGSLDFTKGYPPRETEWNWLSFIGKTATGKSIAVNLVDKFNGNLENCLWLDGQKFILGKANFNNSKPLDKQTWKIETVDGLLSCTLQPKGARSENINLMVMKSQFIQPFGSIEGTVTINNNTEHFTAFGVAEEHEALW